jgi:CRISPR/Cas system-associated endoribonuclease Cas2
MALYLVSYDINEKDAFEYDALWAKLKELGAVRILYSEWAIVTASAGQASSLYGAIAPTTQKKDRLLVQEITDDARWDQLLIADDKFQGLLASARG